MAKVNEVYESTLKELGVLQEDVGENTARVLRGLIGWMSPSDAEGLSEKDYEFLHDMGRAPKADGLIAACAATILPGEHRMDDVLCAVYKALCAYTDSESLKEYYKDQSPIKW